MLNDRCCGFSYCCCGSSVANNWYRVPYLALSSNVITCFCFCPVMHSPTVIWSLRLRSFQCYLAVLRANLGAGTIIIPRRSYPLVTEQRAEHMCLASVVCGGRVSDKLRSMHASGPSPSES